jgi:hypothetical protein
LAVPNDDVGPSLKSAAPLVSSSIRQNSRPPCVSTLSPAGRTLLRMSTAI